MSHQSSTQQYTSIAGGGKKRGMGDRTMVACIHCKERKQKCDAQTPACGNCQRLGRACLVEDPTTKRHQPRNYLQSLEERVALLEGILQQVRPDVASDHFNQGDFSDLDIQTIHSTESQSMNSDCGNNNTLDPFAQPNNEDLCSKVGLLSLESPQGEARYFGSTSAFAFSRVLNPTLRRLGIQGMMSPSEYENYDPMLLVPCPLPPPHIGKILSRAYFENIHPQYPFLHKPTFDAWEEQLMNDYNQLDLETISPLILFFVNMVYAIGAILVPSTGCSSKRFYASAQLYTDHVIQMDSLESVQALLCFTMYSLRSIAGTSMWKLSGLALRQCVELGYHRSPKKVCLSLDPLRLELRKRVFWCAYGIDRAAGICLGRPFGVSDDDIDVEFPLDIDDTLITNIAICGTPRTSNMDLPTTMSAAVHTFRLRLLWSQIHTSLYSTKNAGKDNNPHSPTVLNLRNALMDWRNTTPCGTAPASNDPTLSVFKSESWFNLAYNHSILLLYRSQLTERYATTDPQSIEVFAECARAAREICYGYRQSYIGRPTSYTWGSLQIVFLAGLTYLHCLWTSAALRRATRNDEVSNTCMTCTMVLVVMAERWHAVAAYRDIFEELVSKTMSMLVDRRQDRVAGTTADAPLMLGDESGMTGNMAQWCASIADVGMSDGVEKMLTGFVGNFPVSADT